MAFPKPAVFTSKPKPTEPKFVDKAEAEALERDIRQRISERAHQLYEQSGYQDGNALNHWLLAESEILHQKIEMRDSGTSWMALNAEIPDVSAEDVHIYVDPKRVVVRARKNGRTDPQSQNQGHNELLMATDLPAEVDPPSATASLKDGKLSLMVKKRQPKSSETKLNT